MPDTDLVFNARRDYHTGAHAHADDMLMIPLQGQFTIRADGEHGSGTSSGCLSPAGLYLAPRRHAHSIHASGAQAHLCYYLDASRLAPALPGQGRLLPGSVYLASLATARQQLCLDRPSQRQHEADTLDGLILCEVQRLFGGQASATVWREAALVDAACDFIASHLAEDLSLAQLAETFRVSERSLVRWFSAHKGVSPGRHILDTRLAHAHALLGTPRLSVAQVQVACGFASAAHFAYAFRRRYGVSPSALRTSQASGAGHNSIVLAPIR